MKHFAKKQCSSQKRDKEEENVSLYLIIIKLKEIVLSFNNFDSNRIAICFQFEDVQTG
jgi:hypothetical protein